MPPEKQEKPNLPIVRKLPGAPEGFWSTPGGQGGLTGTVPGVHKVIDEMKIDAHWKHALKAGIAAEIGRTGGNFVELHAHAQRSDNDLHLSIHIKASKRNIL